MPHRCYTWLVVVLALWLVPVARAYGPGVHLREADRYAELHAEVAEPALRPYLHLGAFLPDIRSAGIDLPINTHHKSIGDALLALASESGQAWAVAFATGYRLHTASDTSAQVVFIPWVTAHTGLHAVNLFGSEQLGAEGDNELLVEGWGDFHVGELQSATASRPLTPKGYTPPCGQPSNRSSPKRHSPPLPERPPSSCGVVQVHTTADTAGLRAPGPASLWLANSIEDPICYLPTRRRPAAMALASRSHATSCAVREATWTSSRSRAAAPRGL